MSAFNERVGVTIEESVSNAFNASGGVSTRNIGILMETERGVPNKPFLVNSFREFTRIFGVKQSSMYSAFVMETLFNNTGGYPSNIYGVRILDVTGSETASLILKDAFSNIQTITRVTVQTASPTQPQIDEISIGASVDIGDIFNITIGAGTLKTFTAATTDPDDVIAGLDAAIGAAVGYTVVPSVDGHRLVITSTANDTAFTTVVSSTNAAFTSDPIATIKAGYHGEEDPGAWANNLRIRVYPPNDPNGLKDLYLLQVYYNNFLVESFNAANWTALFGDINARSEYIMGVVDDPDGVMTHGVFAGNLAGGVYAAPTDEMFEPKYNSTTDAAEGLALFEGVDVQILACPEVFSTNFVYLCENFCRTTGKFFVFSLPYNATESVAENFNNVLATGEASYASSVLNWLEVPASDGVGKMWIPAVGYALGAGYIKKAGLTNNVAWSIPGGLETVARGISRITHDDISEDKIGRYVKKWHTNIIKYVQNVGFCLWTSRTYSTNPLYESVHIRLETNWLVKVLPIRNYRFLQRMNTPSLKAEMKNDNRMFMLNLYQQGGIEQSLPFDEAVVIEVVTASDDRKNVDLLISWVPPELVEHIHIKLSRNDGIIFLNA